MRSETPRREGTRLRGDKGELDRFGGVKAHVCGISVPQGRQRDWDDDLWLLHPNYI